MRRALGRLGGTLIHPRRTLQTVMDGEGSVVEVLPIGALVALMEAPQQAGQALLTARLAPVDGLMSVAMLIANRMLVPALSALAGAVILTFLARTFAHAPRDFDFDRALDTAAYALIPFFLLAALGATLSAQGVELWFLPHRPTTGSVPIVAIRIVAGYGWSLLLFGVKAWDIVRGPRP